MRPDERWLSVLANQWLLTAVFNRTTSPEQPPRSMVLARELRVMDGYQLAMIRWYLLQHREVQAVWFEQRETDLVLGIEFCFLKEN